MREYKDYTFTLKSGHKVEVKYYPNYFEGVIDHADFWGDSISSTGYKSFFSHFEESDLEKIAQELEDEYYTDEVKAQREQSNLFL